MYGGQRTECGGMPVLRCECSLGGHRPVALSITNSVCICLVARGRLLLLNLEVPVVLNACTAGSSESQCPPGAPAYMATRTTGSLGAYVYDTRLARATGSPPWRAIPVVWVFSPWRRADSWRAAGGDELKREGGKGGRGEEGGGEKGRLVGVGAEGRAPGCLNSRSAAPCV